MQKEWPENIYCNHPFDPSRLQTREVSIGTLKLGSNHPVRIQSMTSTSTMDTGASVEQCVRIIEAGADLVRLTAQNIAEAENLAVIRKELRLRGFQTPLIADIHFNPLIAEVAARNVEKIRINPGNYISKSGDKNLGVSAIKKTLKPLIETCKDHQTAIRIGVNHGSLSERILQQYGDTPEGMVVSALEFLKIFQEEEFHQLVFSMKSSNTRIMIQAYRLLVHKMLETGQVYPLHLGVTEAGEGEDGRLKSAVGIGSLLADGIGDTIRVSLTEDPEFEIPVANSLIKLFKNIESKDPSLDPQDYPITPFKFNQRSSLQIQNIGSRAAPIVVAEFHDSGMNPEESLLSAGFNRDTKSGLWCTTDRSADYMYFGNQKPTFSLPETLSGIIESTAWSPEMEQDRIYPLFESDHFFNSSNKSNHLNFVRLTNWDDRFLEFGDKVVLVMEGEELSVFHRWRQIFVSMLQKKCNLPVILKFQPQNLESSVLQLTSAVLFGGLLSDGLSDGIWISGKETYTDLMFGILQASRVRTTKTEYISCPSCGRTLFNIQEATSRIRKETAHLKGLKIGIMGCIVNGPGEMADADYGYVGSGIGKVNIYKEKSIVRRNVHSDKALEELIRVIKENGDWVDP